MLLIGLSLVSGLGLLEDVIPQIRSAALDLRHIATFTIALSVASTTLLSIIWWIGPGATAPLQSGSHFKVPEFITANASTEERYKSIILKSENDRLVYYIVRDRELELGDSELIYGSDRDIDEAISGLVTGVGIDSSATLGRNGIRYLFLASPYSKGLARTIDGIGGFTRASSTDDGIVWKVVGASSRVSLAPFERASKNDGLEIPVASNQVSAEGTISRPGIITLAERFDGRWKLYLNNQSIPLIESIDGLPQFEITEPGDFLLIHDGTARRGWISLQFIFFALALILAAPARRRRSDVPMEELA